MSTPGVWGSGVQEKEKPREALRHGHGWPPNPGRKHSSSLCWGTSVCHGSALEPAGQAPRIWMTICGVLGPTQGTAGRMIRTQTWLRLSGHTHSQAAPRVGLPRGLHAVCFPEPPGELSRRSRSPPPEIWVERVACADVSPGWGTTGLDIAFSWWGVFGCKYGGYVKP